MNVPDRLAAYRSRFGFSQGATRATESSQRRAQDDIKSALAEFDGLFAGLSYLDKMDSSPAHPSTLDINLESPLQDNPANDPTPGVSHAAERVNFEIPLHLPSASLTADPKLFERIIEDQLGDDGASPTVGVGPESNHDDWAELRTLRAATEHHYHLFHQACLRLWPHRHIQDLLVEYSSARELRNAGLLVFRDVLEGRSPSGLSEVFAFASLSYAISKLLYQRKHIEKDDILSGIMVWRRAISCAEEKAAFDLLARELWKESKDILHGIPLPAQILERALPNPPQIHPESKCSDSLPSPSPSPSLLPLATRNPDSLLSGVQNDLSQQFGLPVPQEYGEASPFPAQAGPSWGHAPQGALPSLHEQHLDFWQPSHELHFEPLQQVDEVFHPTLLDHAVHLGNQSRRTLNFTRFNHQKPSGEPPEPLFGATLNNTQADGQHGSGDASPPSVRELQNTAVFACVWMYFGEDLKNGVRWLFVYIMLRLSPWTGDRLGEARSYRRDRFLSLMAERFFKPLQDREPALDRQLLALLEMARAFIWLGRLLTVSDVGSYVLFVASNIASCPLVEFNNCVREQVKTVEQEHSAGIPYPSHRRPRPRNEEEEEEGNGERASSPPRRRRRTSPGQTVAVGSQQVNGNGSNDDSNDGDDNIIDEEQQPMEVLPQPSPSAEHRHPPPPPPLIPVIRIPQADGERNSAGKFPCRIRGCNRSFANIPNRSRHESSAPEHGNKPTPCAFPGCPYQGTRRDSRRRHWENRHRDVPLPAELQRRAPRGADAVHGGQNGSEIVTKGE